MAALVASLFAFAAIGGLMVAYRTGSGRALMFGLGDAVIGLVAFCIWASSL